MDCGNEMSNEFLSWQVVDRRCGNIATGMPWSRHSCCNWQTQVYLADLPHQLTCGVIAIWLPRVSQQKAFLARPFEWKVIALKCFAALPNEPSSVVVTKIYSATSFQGLSEISLFSQFFNYRRGLHGTVLSGISTESEVVMNFSLYLHRDYLFRQCLRSLF